MRQKNNKILYYVLGALVIIGIAFIATKEISPAQIQVEKTIIIKK